jgi:dTDP-4-amino-4,6-dideoxygalactose transaminase
MIPQAAPQLRIARYRPAVEKEVREVLAGDQYISGRRVAAFERAFADHVGARCCVGVNSGTDAIALGLRALGIGPGDEVLTASLTAAGTGMAIVLAGAEPRFVDVDPRTRCLDLDHVEASINPRTAAIVPVHLHGRPVDMPRLMAVADRHALAVLEDCAQAHGARVAGAHVGTFGHAGAFSFYPTKNLGCVGDGGAVVTRDEAVAARVRALGSYGWRDGNRVSLEVGGNSRLDEIQAAVLLALLPHLEEGNGERVALAHQYRELLRGADVGVPDEHPGAVYHQFAITAERREELRSHLREQAGILTGVHYPNPLHREPAFAAFHQGPLPVTESLADRLISLPIQPEVATGRVPEIVLAIRRGLACRA